MLEKLSYLTSSIAKLSKDIIAIVLYGSYARDEAGRKSDIDLLIIMEKKKDGLERKVSDILEKTSTGRRTIPVFMTVKELTENPYYTFDIIRDGILLYKNPSKSLHLPFVFGERAMTIYTINLKKVSQKERVKLGIKLYGSGVYKKKIGKGKTKTYKYPGVIAMLGGRKLGACCFIIPSNAEKRIDVMLKTNFKKIVFKKSHIIHVENVS